MGSTGNGKKSTSQVVDLASLPEVDQLNKIMQLQVEMGQTGFEAGDPNESPNGKLYVNTGKSWVINTYLNSDGKTMDTPNTDWDDLVSESWVKDAIKKIDAGMKPMSQSVQTSRFLSANAASKMLGIQITDNFINALAEGKGVGAKELKKNFADMLGGLDYTHKAYTSTTYSGKHGSYDKYPVKLNMVIKKGTDAIVTNNHKEYEIVVGRNKKYNFTKKFHVESLSNGKKQLVIDVVI